jgi:hypothetical protein
LVTKNNARAKPKKYGKEIKNNKMNCAGGGGGAPHSVSVSWISLLRLLFLFVRSSPIKDCPCAEKEEEESFLFLFESC